MWSSLFIIKNYPWPVETTVVSTPGANCSSLGHRYGSRSNLWISGREGNRNLLNLQPIDRLHCDVTCLTFSGSVSSCWSKHSGNSSPSSGSGSSINSSSSGNNSSSSSSSSSCISSIISNNTSGITSSSSCISSSSSSSSGSDGGGKHDHMAVQHDQVHIFYWEKGHKRFSQAASSAFCFMVGKISHLTIPASKRYKQLTTSLKVLISLFCSRCK